MAFVKSLSWPTYKRLIVLVTCELHKIDCFKGCEVEEDQTPVMK